MNFEDAIQTMNLAKVKYRLQEAIDEQTSIEEVFRKFVEGGMVERWEFSADGAKSWKFMVHFKDPKGIENFRLPVKRG
jgi:hypothetical protein